MASCTTSFMTGFRVISYNSRGCTNSFKRNYLSDVLSRCEFLFLQEHWLAEGQLDSLNEVSHAHYATAISGFGNSEVLKGRPYGGCAIFWPRNLTARVDMIKTDSNRICALNVCDDINSLLFVNVYMPFESTDANYDEFCCVLSQVMHIAEQFPDSHLILGGDFNVDFARRGLHAEFLEKLCSDNNLCLAVNHMSSTVDYTYNFCMQRFSVLDHFVVSSVVFDSCISSIGVMHDADNHSDHDPMQLTLHMDWNCRLNASSERAFHSRPAWFRASANQIDMYKNKLRDNVNSITLPTAALLCNDVWCCNAQHGETLKKYSSDIIRCCIEAASCTIPHTSTGKGKPVPGWDEYVAPFREKSILWHKMWIDCGRPHSGVVAEIMRRTRAAYHYAIRRVKKNETEIVRERFADMILQNKSRDFWSEVQRMKSSKTAVSATVDGVSGCNEIADMFANQYDELYSCVAYDSCELASLKNDINNRLCSQAYNQNSKVNFGDVNDAVQELKRGKRDGFSGLMSDHVINACDELFIHISLLLSSMLVHGTPSDDLLVSTIVPIPKGKTGNRTASSNYRAIALSSIFGKIFDKIVLNRYSDAIMTSHLQFGFKKGHSTTMCSLVVKETIEYYNAHRSTVYCTMLDATKAFDRVQYCKLFRKLIDRNIPAVILRLLLIMYTEHRTHVEWNGSHSRWFPVLNGVKQGGVLSPILFCIYIDGLLNKLNSSMTGCCIGSQFTGALAYADDIVLLAPTAAAMRSMLKICEEYAKAFDVVFNASKSKCVICRHRGAVRNNTDRSVEKMSFEICGNAIEVVTSWPHLGHIISDDCDDKLDILNRRCSFIGQANNLICVFGKLDCSVKTKLLKSYCFSFYGCELWDLHNVNIDALCKSWRQAVQMPCCYS